MNDKLMTYSFRSMLFIILISISVFAFAPGDWTPDWIVNHDKFSHFIVFFILSFLLKNSYPKMGLLTITSILLLLSFLIEILQLVFFNRGFSFLDLGYDIIGIILFVVIIKCLEYLGLKQYNQIKNLTFD